MLQSYDSGSALRARVDYLEEENRQLRDILGIEPTLQFNSAAKRVFGLSKSQARILRVLLTGKTRSNDALMSAYSASDDQPTANTLKVQLLRVRRRLQPYGITIRNEHGVGYSISEEGRAKALDMIEAAGE